MEMGIFKGWVNPHFHTAIAIWKRGAVSLCSLYRNGDSHMETRISKGQGMCKSPTQSTANEPGRLGDQLRWMGRIHSRITIDVVERLWSN